MRCPTQRPSSERRTPSDLSVIEGESHRDLDQTSRGRKATRSYPRLAPRNNVEGASQTVAKRRSRFVTFGETSSLRRRTQPCPDRNLVPMFPRAVLRSNQVWYSSQTPKGWPPRGTSFEVESVKDEGEK